MQYRYNREPTAVQREREHQRRGSTGTTNKQSLQSRIFGWTDQQNSVVPDLMQLLNQPDQPRYVRGNRLQAANRSAVHGYVQRGLERRPQHALDGMIGYNSQYEANQPNQTNFVADGRVVAETQVNAAMVDDLDQRPLINGMRRLDHTLRALNQALRSVSSSERRRLAPATHLPSSNPHTVGYSIPNSVKFAEPTDLNDKVWCK